MSKTGQYKIPFDQSGNQMNYPESWRVPVIDWRENYTFTATLYLENYSKGRSAMNFVLQDNEGRTYVMALSEFFRLCKSGRFSDTKVTGNWTFYKQGANYFIKEAL